MGNSGPIKTLFDPIIYDFDMNLVLTTEYTRKWKKLFEEIESLRSRFVNVWGKLLYESGAIVLVKPNYYNCIEGLLFQIARTAGGNTLEKIVIQSNKAYIDFKSPEEFEKNKETYLAMQNFLIECELNKEKVYPEVMKKVLKEIEYFKIKKFIWETKISKEKNEISRKEKQSIFEMLEIEMIHARDIIVDINEIIDNIFEENINFVHKYSASNRESEIKTFTRISLEFEKYIDIYSDNRVLYYNYTSGKKFHNFNDWQFLYKKIQSNKVLVIENSEITKDENKKETEIDETPELLEEMEISQLLEKQKILEKELKDLENEIQRKENEIDNKTVLFVNEEIPLRNSGLHFTWFIALKEDEVQCFCYNFVMNYLFVGTKAGKINCYDLVKRTKIDSIYYDLKVKVKVLCDLNDGRSIISGTKDGKLTKWQINNRTNKELVLKEKRISNIILSEQGDKIYVSSGSTFYQIDIVTMQIDSEYSFNKEDGRITSMIKIQGTDNFCFGFCKGKVKLYRSQNKRILFEKHIQDDKITALAQIEKNDKQLIVASSKDSKNLITVYQSTNLELIEQSINDQILQSYIRRIESNYDKKSLILSDKDGNVVVYNYIENKKKNELKLRRKKKVNCMIYLRDGLTLVLGHSDLEVFMLKN